MVSTKNTRLFLMLHVFFFKIVVLMMGVIFINFQVRELRVVPQGAVSALAAAIKVLDTNSSSASGNGSPDEFCLVVPLCPTGMTNHAICQTAHITFITSSLQEVFSLGRFIARIAPGFCTRVFHAFYTRRQQLESALFCRDSVDFMTHALLVKCL